ERVVRSAVRSDSRRTEPSDGQFTSKATFWLTTTGPGRPTLLFTRPDSTAPAATPGMQLMSPNVATGSFELPAIRRPVLLPVVEMPVQMPGVSANLVPAAFALPKQPLKLLQLPIPAPEQQTLGLPAAMQSLLPA